MLSDSAGRCSAHTHLLVCVLQHTHTHTHQRFALNRRSNEFLSKMPSQLVTEITVSADTKSDIFGRSCAVEIAEKIVTSSSTIRSFLRKGLRPDILVSTRNAFALVRLLEISQRNGATINPKHSIYMRARLPLRSSISSPWPFEKRARVENKIPFPCLYEQMETRISRNRLPSRAFSPRSSHSEILKGPLSTKSNVVRGRKCRSGV